MGRLARIGAEFGAAWWAFLRRRTAVFFTFFFPAILIVIFGVLVGTRPTGGGLFAEPAGYYVPGYLAVVVLFTPLSRLGSTVARGREHNRFEKLATTPLQRWEWLAAHALVNVAIVGLAAVLVVGLVLALTGAEVALSPWIAPFVAVGVVAFCGVGALLGRLADSQDGAVAASNAVGLPLLFLSETFVPPRLLPAWFVPLLDLSPLTYFARGVRAATFYLPAGTAVSPRSAPAVTLAVLAGFALLFFVAGAYAIPWTD